MIYEKCDELLSFSDGLLCSYNRLIGSHCALQSFGDARGERLDFYRLFRLCERGEAPKRCRRALALLGSMEKGQLLDEVLRLIETGTCNKHGMELLECMGYVREGRICVPVYGAAGNAAAERLEAVVENSLGEEIAKTLKELAATLRITCVAHGVAGKEIANELYHILFGCINEELVRMGIVASPPDTANEGRYLKCIELF